MPDLSEPDALSRALMKSSPGLAGRVHYVNGAPWCDGVNHTTMCEPEPKALSVSSDGRPAVRALTEDERGMTYLLPFLKAARTGLRNSRWRPGMHSDELLAPIVLAVLVEVSRELRLGELNAEATT